MELKDFLKNIDLTSINRLDKKAENKSDKILANN